MSDRPPMRHTAFHGHRLLHTGPLAEVARAVKAATEGGSPTAILVFDDATGRVVDLDLRGTAEEVVERLSRPPQALVGRHRPPSSAPAASADEEAAGVAAESGEGTGARGRGRPRLGVVAREVTLMPKQWDWLAAQPGGTSAVLRRLVDDARRNSGAHQARRAAQEATYHFLHAIAGDLPGYEEATRALFADDRPRLEQSLAALPPDIRAYALRLAFAGSETPPREDARQATP